MSHYIRLLLLGKLREKVGQSLFGGLAKVWIALLMIIKGMVCGILKCHDKAIAWFCLYPEFCYIT